MSPAPGPPGAAVPPPPRANSFNAPFPRANNTTRLNLPRRLPAATKAMLPPRPHAGTMGPPPPARSRNAKFDQMFYTSPLPRSISRAYNEMQAGGTAMVSSALRTGVTTTRTVVPRVGVVPARSSPRGKAATPVGEKESLAVSVSATTTTPESAAAAPDRAEPQSLPEPAVRAGEGVSGEKKAVETVAAAKSPSPVPALPVSRSFAEAWVEEDNAFMMSLSDDDDREWHPLARSKPASKANSNPTAPAHAVEQGAKHANPAPPRGKRTVKTRARVAPVKKTKPVVRTRGVATKVVRGVAKERHEKKVQIRKAQSKRPSAQQKPNPTPTPTAAAAALKQNWSVLPGFQVPPGILAKTGSGWDPGSGRRLSRRVSTGVPSSSSSDIYARTPATRSRQRRASAGMLSAPARIPSPVPAPVEGNDTLAPADTSAPAEETFTRKAPKPRPEASRSAVEKERIPAPDISITTTPAARRSTRNSLGHATAAQLPDSDPRRPTPASAKRPRSSIGDLQVLVGTSSSSSRRSPRTAASEKKTTLLSKFHHHHHQDTPRSPLQPPLPPPPPLKKTRRSLRGAPDLPSFVVEVEETPPPQKGVARARVVEETPRHRTTRRRSAPGKKGGVNPEFEFSDGEQD